MKTIFTAVISLFISFTGMAQDVINLWPDNAIPNMIAGKSLTEKSETGADGILRISNVTVPTLTVYPAATGKATGAAVMICPGGGYWILAASHEGSDMAKWFTERGITAIVLKYRLPNDQVMTHPEEVPLLDAMQGMKLIRQHATRYGIAPEKIGVMGFSAGGHLAATLSTHYFRESEATAAAKPNATQPNAAERSPAERSPARPNFAILLYPVITFGEKAHAGSREKLLGKNPSAGQIAYYSNELQVTNQTPPTLLIHSMNDTAVPVENSIDYYLAMKKAGVPAEMHLYPTGGHGYALRTTGKGSVANWPAACEGWLKNLGYIK